MTDRARARASSAAADLLITGPLFDLPAGRATTSVTISGASNDFASRSTRSGVVRDTSFSRDLAGVRSNVDLPITSRRRNFGAGIGDLALNANAAIQRLSDAGTLTTVGYGLRWTPIPAIRFIASQTIDRDAPSGQQINDPLIVTPDVPVFDYRTGDTVFVARVSGGNPALLESERNRVRLQVTAKPVHRARPDADRNLHRQPAPTMRSAASRSRPRRSRRRSRGGSCATRADS